ncbi:putative ribonuclease P/MRP protein subunit POP5 [Curcuma longa]|uniref:putative ribonuclease P/MRP protein subunit POP5 n=1 Tax=Curcuma longa TaxID=136217 RepID=UPI003D9DE73C
MVQFKNRYLVMEIFIHGERDFIGRDTLRVISSSSISKAIKESVQLNFGECGLALLLGSLQVKYVNATTKICIIRVSRSEYQKVWSAITMIRSIGNNPATFNLLDLSGSIRACKKAAIKCEEAKYEQYVLATGDSVSLDFTNARKDSIGKINALDS